MGFKFFVFPDFIGAGGVINASSLIVRLLVTVEDKLAVNPSAIYINFGSPVAFLKGSIARDSGFDADCTPKVLIGLDAIAWKIQKIVEPPTRKTPAAITTKPPVARLRAAGGFEICDVPVPSIPLSGTANAGVTAECATRVEYEDDCAG